jgi:hypothetical protein
MGFEFLLTPGTSEESALIRYGLKINLKDPVYPGLLKSHDELTSLWAVLRIVYDYGLGPAARKQQLI